MSHFLPVLKLPWRVREQLGMCAAFCAPLRPRVTCRTRLLWNPHAKAFSEDAQIINSPGQHLHKMSGGTDTFEIHLWCLWSLIKKSCLPDKLEGFHPTSLIKKLKFHFVCSQYSFHGFLIHALKWLRETIAWRVVKHCCPFPAWLAPRDLWTSDNENQSHTSSLNINTLLQKAALSHAYVQSLEFPTLAP